VYFLQIPAYWERAVIIIYLASFDHA
jgi:hypothetical protein